MGGVISHSTTGEVPETKSQDSYGRRHAPNLTTSVQPVRFPRGPHAACASRKCLPKVSICQQEPMGSRRGPG